MGEPEPWGTHRPADKDADPVTLDLRRQLVEWASTADPGIHVTWPPIVGCDRVGPTAVAPVQLGEIGAAEHAVLLLVKAVAAAGIRCCSRGWPVDLGTPHLWI